MSRFVDVGATEDLADGAMKTVRVEGRDVLLARAGEIFYAADSRCPHMGGRLSEGILEGKVVTCPRHGSRFDLDDGRVVQWTTWTGITLALAKLFKPPRPLHVYQVELRGDRVLVDLGESL